GCIFNVINALVNPGDEVVIIDPHYDCYPSMVQAVGAKPVFVPLLPPKSSTDGATSVNANDWQWDRYQLDSVFSQRTKLLVLNSPQNPLGKVYNRDELLVLAELCQKHDVVCLSDEVYEWMDGYNARYVGPNYHGGSAGKCFNITGWRVGWCVGPAALISHVVTVQSEVVFSVASPLQAAIGRVFRSELNNIKGKDDSCLAKLRSHVKANRDLAVAELSRMGLSCVIPSGGWFMLVPVAPRLLPLLRDTSASKGPASDVSIVELITKKIRLATIPASMFYSEEFRCTVGHGYLRLCLNKRRETLGFPDYAPPKSATDALASVANSSNPMFHQYTRGYGHPRLVNALAKLYTTELQNPIDPMKNILISNGAYMCLYSAIHSLVDEGDEVVIIEPFFDCYEPMVRSAGGQPVFVPLRPSADDRSTTQNQRHRSAQDWRWDAEQLRAAFTPRTKMLIMNTPNNPIGKGVYPGHRHRRIATLPGMWERTITVGSAGKTFSATGWKLGWSIGPEELIKHLQVVHRNCCYTCPTPSQEAVGIALEAELERRGTPECYFNALPTELLSKRDRLAELVESAGLPVYLPAGGYFMIVDISSLPEPPPATGSPDDPLGELRDARLVRWLTRERQLATIPCSCFYGQADRHLGENFIRLCFIKEDETIEQFGRGLLNWLKPGSC
uniref:kynurenine--oxoglutarate transaminase n=1 Tax=Macrostomum lignano TaxID=282301 RepID=A0A1I8HA72_9PLAT